MAQWTREQTISEVVTSLMQSMGLTAPNTIVDGSNSTALQMVALANQVGVDLLSHRWQFLEADHEITLTASTTYDLPADFDAYRPDEQWNQSTALPVIGPVSGREWSALQGMTAVGGPFRTLFRISGNQIEFQSVTAGDVVVFPYWTRGWVERATGDRADNIVANDDIVLHDIALFRHALKLKWYEAKHFDTSKLLKDLQPLIDAAKARDCPGRTLSLNPSASLLLLGDHNIPETGFGS